MSLKKGGKAEACSMTVFNLGELPEKQITSFGNKAAGLNKLSRYGFNIPSGYAVSNKEFHDFLKFNRIRLDHNTILFYPEKILEKTKNGKFPASTRD